MSKENIRIDEIHYIWHWQLNQMFILEFHTFFVIIYPNCLKFSIEFVFNRSNKLFGGKSQVGFNNENLVALNKLVFCAFVPFSFQFMTLKQTILFEWNEECCSNCRFSARILNIINGHCLYELMLMNLNLELMQC